MIANVARRFAAGWCHGRTRTLHPDRAAAVVTRGVATVRPDRRGREALPLVGQPGQHSCFVGDDATDTRGASYFRSHVQVQLFWNVCCWTSTSPCMRPLAGDASG